MCGGKQKRSAHGSASDLNAILCSGSPVFPRSFNGCFRLWRERHGMVCRAAPRHPRPVRRPGPTMASRGSAVLIAYPNNKKKTCYSKFKGIAIAI